MLLDVLLSSDAKSLDMRQCIQQDLYRLMNTKQGSLCHMPDYGLPDLRTIYQTLPDGKIEFVLMIKKTIEKYEPRLTDVTIDEDLINHRACVLSLTITADIKGNEQAQFDSYFYSAGHVQLS